MPSDEKAEKAMTNLEGESPDCQEVLRNMYSFLDNELDTATCAHVQQHLDDCIPCLESFEFETELKHVIAKKCKDEAPGDLIKKVQSCLKQEIEGTGAQGGIPTA